MLEEVREQLAILLRCSYVLESSINNEDELDSGDNDGGEGDSGNEQTTTVPDARSRRRVGIDVDVLVPCEM